MTSYGRHQAHRPPPTWVSLLGLLAYLLVAAGVAGALWFVLQAFLSMGTYIQTVAP